MGSMLAVATTSAWAHTPYRFWNVFRKRNMQILTSLEDVPGDDTGEAWVTVLREKLPLSRAMVSRAHKMTRTASLLKTNQVKLAVLSGFNNPSERDFTFSLNSFLSNNGISSSVFNDILGQARNNPPDIGAYEF